MCHLSLCLNTRLIFLNSDMLNPGAFTGTRKEFLLSQRVIYAEAISRDNRVECLMDIQRHYFKRFPIELPHNVDPDPEALKQVDDSAPDPEVVIPDETKMSAEEYASEKKKFEKHQEYLDFRKKVSSRLPLIINLRPAIVCHDL